MRRGMIGAALVASVALASAACAETVRQPEQGTPAIVVEAPEGWRLLREGDGLALAKGNRVLTAEIVTLRADRQPADHVRTMFDDTGCKPTGVARPERQGGRAGERLSCVSRGASGASVITVFVTRLDASHAGLVAQMRDDALQPAEITELERLAGSVRFVTAR